VPRPWLLLVIGLAVGWIAGYLKGRQATLLAPPPRLPEPGEMPDLEDLVRHGKKIDAIKLFRARTQARLAEAKAVVDAIERRLRG